jgi:hypothetical protein
MKNKEIISIKKNQKSRSIVGVVMIIGSTLIMILPLLLMIEDAGQKLVMVVSGFLLMIFGVILLVTSPIIERCNRCGENYGFYFRHDHSYDNNEDHPEDECLRNLKRKLNSL